MALHVRRGDLTKSDEHALPDAWYYRLIDRIRRHAPRADIHVWSSTENMGQRPIWTSRDFDGFRSRGCTVHLDDEDLLEPWAHFARADIFVATKSHFSEIGAMLNPYCVIAPKETFSALTQRRMLRLLRGAVEGHLPEGLMSGDGESRPSYDAELAACAARGSGARA